MSEVQSKTKNELINGITTFWNNKIDHLYKVIDRLVALTGVATGL